VGLPAIADCFTSIFKFQASTQAATVVAVALASCDFKFGAGNDVKPAARRRPDRRTQGALSSQPTSTQAQATIGSGYPVVQVLK